MNLGEVERLVSRAQVCSIVEATQRKLALWYGSISAGKTIASLFALLLAVRVAPRNGLIIIVGKSLHTIYQNIFIPFQDAELFGSRITSQIRYTPGANTATILGREVQLVGATDSKAVGRIQGSTVGLAYVDEAALLPEDFWNMLVSRLRVTGARLLATMNPASMNHWIRKKWILQAATKNLISFHFTMDDNPQLSEAYKADMRASFSGVFYDRMIRGLWTNAAGAVYPMWDPSAHVIPFDRMPPVQEIIGVGMDYGTTNATTAVMLGLTDEPQPRLVFMDEWGYNSRETGIRLTDAELSRRFRRWLPQEHTPYPTVLTPRFIMRDPSAASFAAQLQSDGITTWAANNTVNAGIATIATLLDQNRLIVTDRCAGWQSEVTEYRWDDKATEQGHDMVIKEDDHYLDAGRYITYSTKNVWAGHLQTPPTT